MAAVEPCSTCGGDRPPGDDVFGGEGMAGHTVAALIPSYLRERQALGSYVHDRARGARSTLYNFADHVGRRRLTHIGTSHVEAWLIGMEHLAPATRRDRLSTVRAFFGWAVRKGYCRRNPAAEVRGPKQPRTVPRALADTQIAAVLEHCPDARGRLIVTLMVQQGLRCCEVSRLTVGDVDMQHGTMRVVGKGHHERILPITAETTGALEEYLVEHPAVAGPLVRSYRQAHRALVADTISGMVSGWMWAAGIKRAARDGVSAHAGRHTCATDMLRRGAHLRDVQAALGHRHLQTTEEYLPHVVNGLAEAMSGRTYRQVRPSASGRG